MIKKGFSAAVAVVALCTGIAPVMADPRIDEARAIVKEFAGALQSELKAAMKADGPVKAVQVCHSRAPEIAAELSAKHGWQVGRTSLKRRNAGNAPDDWEISAMQQFEQRKMAGEPAGQLEFAAPVSVDGQQQFRYMKAIPTQAICLTCHGGESVPPAVVAEIAKYYPDDMARGFSEGDLRGAFTLSKAR